MIRISLGMTDKGNARLLELTNRLNKSQIEVVEGLLFGVPDDQVAATIEEGVKQRIGEKELRKKAREAIETIPADKLQAVLEQLQKENN